MTNVAQNSVKERFESLRAHCELFSFLYEYEQLEERYVDDTMLCYEEISRAN